MLYQLYDWQRAALEPWRLFAQAGQRDLRPPGQPALVPARQPQRGRRLRPDDAPHAATTSARRSASTRVRSGEREYAVTRGLRHREALLPPAALREGGRAAAAARDRVRAALGPLRRRCCATRCKTLLADHDVWVTDWIDAKEIPITVGAVPLRRLRGLRARVHRLHRPRARTRSRCASRRCRCSPAVSLMAAAGEPIPRTLTMMGGPIDTRRSPTAVNNFATTRPLSWFEAKVIQRVPMRYPGFMRRVYPGFLQFAGFVAMNPDRHMESHVQYYQHLVEGDGDSADAHRALLRRVQRGDGPAGRVLPRDRRARVPEAPAAAGQARGRRRARAPRGDQGQRRSSPSRASSTTSPATARPRPRRGSPRASRASDKQHFEAKGVGHYGIFSGRKYREMIYPRIREFIAQH